MRKLSKVIVVDVECTCWDDNRPGPKPYMEIIEVGVCLLDLKTLEPEEPQQILVQPTSSDVSEFCTRLTGLTQAQVDEGVAFRELCQTLKRSYYNAPGRPWASYGDFDRNQFRRQCERESVKYPFGPTHTNVKSLLAQALGWPEEVAMSEALELLGLPLVGRHHCGRDDAFNIACIYAWLLRRVRL